MENTLVILDTGPMLIHYKDSSELKKIVHSSYIIIDALSSLTLTDVSKFYRTSRSAGDFKVINS